MHIPQLLPKEGPASLLSITKIHPPIEGHFDIKLTDISTLVQQEKAMNLALIIHTSISKIWGGTKKQTSVVRTEINRKNGK